MEENCSSLDIEIFKEEIGNNSIDFTDECENPLEDATDNSFNANVDETSNATQEYAESFLNEEAEEESHSDFSKETRGNKSKSSVESKEENNSEDSEYLSMEVVDEEHDTSHEIISENNSELSDKVITEPVSGTRNSQVVLKKLPPGLRFPVIVITKPPIPITSSDGSTSLYVGKRHRAQEIHSLTSQSELKRTKLTNWTRHLQDKSGSTLQPNTSASQDESDPIREEQEQERVEKTQAPKSTTHKTYLSLRTRVEMGLVETRRKLLEIQEKRLNLQERRINIEIRKKKLGADKAKFEKDMIKRRLELQKELEDKCRKYDLEFNVKLHKVNMESNERLIELLHKLV